MYCKFGGAWFKLAECSAFVDAVLTVTIDLSSDPLTDQLKYFIIPFKHTDVGRFFSHPRQ